jgi:hypothetical protein
MRKQTEIQDRLRYAQAAYDEAKDNLDGMLTGRITFGGDVPTPAELLQTMEQSMQLVHIYKWMLGLE